MKKGVPILLAAFLVFILLSDQIIIIQGEDGLCEVKCEKCGGKCSPESCSQQCQLQTQNSGKCRGLFKSGLFERICMCFIPCGGRGDDPKPKPGPPSDDPPHDNNDDSARIRRAH